jgi:hypothetical protein
VVWDRDNTQEVVAYKENNHDWGVEGNMDFTAFNSISIQMLRFIQELNQEKVLDMEEDLVVA